jgi:hypothetical protein
MIEDVGDRTVLAGASSRTGTRSGERVEQVSEADPADDEPPDASSSVDTQVPG